MHFSLCKTNPFLHWHPLNWQNVWLQLPGTGFSHVGWQGLGQSTTSAFSSSQPENHTSALTIFPIKRLFQSPVLTHSFWDRCKSRSCPWPGHWYNGRLEHKVFLEVLQRTDIGCCLDIGRNWVQEDMFVDKGRLLRSLCTRVLVWNGILKFEFCRWIEFFFCSQYTNFSFVVSCFEFWWV